jgi:hypothetical protein
MAIDPKVMKEITDLAQHLADECLGKPVLVVQSAIGHLLAQVIMKNQNSQRDVFKNIDGMAKAMKEDVRLIYKSRQN